MTEEIKKSVASNFIAYHVRKSANGKSYWTRIGTSLAHEDGKGFNVLVDLVPLDGVIVLRTPSDKK